MRELARHRHERSMLRRASPRRRPRSARRRSPRTRRRGVVPPTRSTGCLSGGRHGARRCGSGGAQAPRRPLGAASGSGGGVPFAASAIESAQSVRPAPTMRRVRAAYTRSSTNQKDTTSPKIFAILVRRADQLVLTAVALLRVGVRGVARRQAASAPRSRAVDPRPSRHLVSRPPPTVEELAVGAARRRWIRPPPRHIFLGRSGRRRQLRGVALGLRWGLVSHRP